MVGGVDHFLLTMEGLRPILDAFWMVKHRWDQSLGIPNGPSVSSVSQDCQSTFHGAGNTQHQPPRMGSLCHEGSFPPTTGTLLLAVSLELGREDFICCHSNQQKRPAVLQKLTEKQSDPLRPAEKKRFGRCKRAVILIRQKPLGDFHTASPSSISNASAYTRLASGALLVLKEGAVLTCGGFMVPTGFVPANSCHGVSKQVWSENRLNQAGHLSLLTLCCLE